MYMSQIQNGSTYFVRLFFFVLALIVLCVSVNLFVVLCAHNTTMLNSLPFFYFFILICTVRSTDSLVVSTPVLCLNTV